MWVMCNPGNIRDPFPRQSPATFPTNAALAETPESLPNERQQLHMHILGLKIVKIVY